MRDHDSTRSSRPAVSRRDFLKGSSAAVAAGAVVGGPAKPATAAPARKNVIGPEPVQITLKVNGKQHTVTVEPRVTLLEVLRNDLNLTGCKEVDENTASGADTVLIDGKAVLASARLAVECEGKEIQTVESLRSGERVDPVVAGFVKHDAMQCGFCTPGFVMAVRAFLNKHPNATLEQIRKGLGGNICRCGTYAGITRCALELARQ